MVKYIFAFICSMTAGQLACQPAPRVLDLRGLWKFSIGDNPRWSALDMDDKDWIEILVPSSWENEGFSGFDGYAWYRKTFELPSKPASAYYLDLGYIDDVDEVYLNGYLIGFTGSFPPKFYTAFQSHRRYIIPINVLNKKGKNILAVRVFDALLEGGILSGNIGIYAYNYPSGFFNLSGLWHFKEGDNQLWKSPQTQPESWDQVMVPGLWRSFKDKHFSESIAWYYKAFQLPDYLKDEKDLVVVLGRIDDFDETYLNGTLIGSTNDGKHYGWSTSYRQYRIYNVSTSLLKKNETNIISVRVKDIGGEAGIYEGPVGIVPRNQLSELTDGFYDD